MWAPRDLQELCLPILNVWKYIGLPIYRLDKSTKRIHQARWSFWNLALIPPLVIITITSYNTIMNDLKNVEDYCNFFKHLFSLIYDVSALILCRKYQARYLNVIAQLMALETSINQDLGRRSNIRKLRQFLTVFSAVKFTVLLVDALIDFLKEDSDLKYIVYYGQWFYNFFIEIFMLYFLVILDEFYGQVQGFVRGEAEYEVGDVIRIFRSLRSASHGFKDSFAGIIMLRSLSEFAFIVTNISYSWYYFYANKIRNLPEMLGYFFYHWPSVPVMLTSNYLMAKYFDDIVEQDHILADFITTDDAGEWRRRLFGFEIELNALRFTIFGLFPINLKYFYGMISAITIFVVYLFQFRIM